jgi:hypothetical protein
LRKNTTTRIDLTQYGPVQANSLVFEARYQIAGII